MGLSSFPTSTEGMLPFIVLNTILSVALLKNMVRSMLQIVGSNRSGFEFEGETDSSPPRQRRISNTQFKFLCDDHTNGGGQSRDDINNECCLCLCSFEDEDEVSELYCKHFFHKSCLEKWFCNEHATCPLCRSSL